MIPSAPSASAQQQDVLSAMLDVAQRVLPADGFAIWRLEARQWHVRASAGISEAFARSIVATHHGGPAMPVESTEPLIFEDVRTASMLNERVEAYDAEGIRSAAVIPLMIAGEGTGTLSLYYRSPHRFTAAELDMARALGQTAAAALTASVLYEEQRRTREWTTFLDRASTALAQSLDLSTTAQTVVDLAIPLFADSCAIHVPGENGGVRLAASAHVDPSKRAAMLKLAGRSRPNRTRGWGRTMVDGTVELFEEIDDKAVGQALGNNPELLAAFDELRFTSQLSVPMFARGRLVGAITFALGPGTRRYNAADVAWAEELARRCGLAIDNARLYDDAQRREAEAAWAEQRATFLAEVGAALASSLDYDETLRTVVRLAVPRVADWCALDMVTGSGAVERLAVMHSDPAKLAAVKETRSYHHPDSPYGPEHVIRTASPVLLANVTDDMIVAIAKGDADQIALVRSTGLVSFICVPLVAHGQAIGALSFVSAESGRHFTEDDLRFAQDVAFRAALAVENARAYEEVRLANHLKDEFLATLSHELRTPLNAIMGWTRLLRDETLPPEKRGRAYEIVDRNAVTLAQIVADILDVSRITAGKLRLEPCPIDVSVVIRDAVAAVQPAADAKGVEIHVSPAATRIAADADRLQQVFWNLVSNAVKFTPHGGRVDVTVEPADDHIAVVVQDTGVGIAPEFLPHVFERFRQAEPRLVREQGGLGLGLSIARHLVEMHGGTIRAASEGLGRGATFRVELPQNPERNMIQPA